VAQGSLVTRVGGISHANRTHLVSHRPADSEVSCLALCDTRMPRLGAWGRGRVTLLGDAAHPMTPNLGQVSQP
jgi:2-polyprenyl-6-methoxyphenol hydroxylase-like FAD-dependent oxidoreductase